MRLRKASAPHCPPLGADQAASHAEQAGAASFSPVPPTDAAEGRSHVSDPRPLCKHPGCDRPWSGGSLLYCVEHELEALEFFEDCGYVG
jgi:hypothetical protein